MSYQENNRRAPQSAATETNTSTSRTAGQSPIRRAAGGSRVASGHSKARGGSHAKPSGGSRIKAKENRRRAIRTARRTREKELYTPSRLRRGRKIGGKELVWLLLTVLAAVAAVGIALLVWDRSSSYEFTEDGIQYYAGNEAFVPAGTVVPLADKDADEEDLAATQAQSSYLPVYMKNSRKLVIGRDVIYYEPRAISYKRLVSMTEIEITAGGVIYASREGKSVSTAKGFLYDGGDLYIFLEPVVVEFNGFRYELPAFSYVEAVYGGNMMLFNYETKEFHTEACDGSGIAGPENGDYSISLLGDSMTLANGSRMLLAGRADNFEPVV